MRKEEWAKIGAGPNSPYLLLSTENPNYQLADGGRLAKNEFRAAYRVLMVMRDI